MTEPVCDTPIEEIARLNAECEAHIARIAELEAECREWKEQCEKGDAKLVRECEEWREQCGKQDARTKAADELAEVVGNLWDFPYPCPELSNYLKVKESK